MNFFHLLDPIDKLYKFGSNFYGHSLCITKYQFFSLNLNVNDKIIQFN